jgi:hypothetical protein
MSNRRYEAEPENAPGDFYVQRDQCMICMLPYVTAPEIFGFHDASLTTGSRAGSHCYVAHQPASPAELDLTIEALTGSCCGAVRYAGTDPDIISRIRNGGNDSSCDYLPGVWSRISALARRCKDQ